MPRPTAAPSDPQGTPRPSRPILSPAHALLLDVYLGALARRGDASGRRVGTLAELEAAFAARYQELRGAPTDPGEDAAFRAALLDL